ncbi:MAG TPA: hypothetical protein PKV98_14105 [Burkholderiaceae bacterium]|nr:hypothetical protein [Burkholderiaceae bacterium]
MRGALRSLPSTVWLLALLWVVAVVMRLYMAATEGAEPALIADLVARDSLGTAYG